MKRLFVIILMVVTIVSVYGQSRIKKYNDIMKRYEYYDSSGQIVGYESWDSTLRQWRYYDAQSTQSHSKQYNKMLERYEYYDSSGRMLGYEKWDSMLRQWKYYDAQSTQSHTKQYNKMLNRYEYYNSLGQIVGYESWDSMLRQWKYNDVQPTQQSQPTRTPQSQVQEYNNSQYDSSLNGSVDINRMNQNLYEISSGERKNIQEKIGQINKLISIKQQAGLITQQRYEFINNTISVGIKNFNYTRGQYSDFVRWLDIVTKEIYNWQ